MPASDYLLGETAGDGKYQIYKHLRGQAATRLYLARSPQSPEERYLASVTHPRSNPAETLRRQLGYQCPGVLELCHISSFDKQGDDEERHVTQSMLTVMIERIPGGTWLPDLMEDRLPLSDAIRLGISTGEILLRAAEKGVMLTDVRPEFMWASGEIGNRWTAGLTARPEELFRQKLRSGVHLAFSTYYYSPEHLRGKPSSERSLTFSLGLMVAHWASGEYPAFIEDDYVPSDALPPLLAQTLARCLALDPASRPSLKETIRDLEQCG
jgi:serine/threonine protein kinase